MLRSIALWGRHDLRVVVPLVLLHAGQWAVSLHNGFSEKDRWGPIGDGLQGCQINSVNLGWLKVQSVYMILFELVVLLVACRPLFRLPGRSELWNILVRDSLLYYLAVLAFSLASTILCYLPDSNVTLVYSVSDVSNLLIPILACRSYARVFCLGETTYVDMGESPISNIEFAKGPVLPITRTISSDSSKADHLGGYLTDMQEDEYTPTQSSLAMNITKPERSVTVYQSHKVFTAAP